MSVTGAAAMASRQQRNCVMRHLLADWHEWTLVERIAAITLAVVSVAIQVAFVLI
jgi:hypothetical protein